MSGPESAPFVAPRPGGQLVVPADEARQIARRAKTQLRRSTRLVRLDDGRRVLRTCGMALGSTYRVLTPAQAAAVTARDDTVDTEPLARIKVTDVRLQLLGSISLEDATAEGCESVARFADRWMRRHDRGWPPREPALCRECHGHAEYVNGEGELVACAVCDFGEITVDQAVAPDETTAAFLTRHGDRPVWVVTFGLDDRRFMHANSMRGYTSDPSEAMRGEPEVLGQPLPAWRARGEERRRRDQRDTDSLRLSGLPSVADELAEMRQMAAERGVDLTRERHVLQVEIDRLAAKLNGPS